jgi:hypothetical protein
MARSRSLAPTCSATQLQDTAGSYVKVRAYWRAGAVMNADDESRQDRDKIAELNAIHAQLRWWSDEDIVALIAEDLDLAKAVWRDDQARGTLLRALAEIDPTAADELRTRNGQERRLDVLLRRSLAQLSRRRR